MSKTLTRVSGRTFDRRSAMKMVGGSAAALVLTKPVAALATLQDATPVALQPGPQDDGTTLWHVTVGGMDMENGLDFQAFFPGSLTINAGDSVWFDFHMPGFHTVYFANGGELPALFIPDPESATPAADAPPKLILNPEFLFPTEAASVDGSGPVNSGVDVFRDPSVPFVANFPVAGTFDYLCVPHQGVMKATITVQEAGAAYPATQEEVDAANAEQLAALQAEGMAEIETYSEATGEDRDDGTKRWTAAAGAGPGQVRVMRFLPDVLEIGVGDTVNWVIQSPGEPHTVSFVGSDAEPKEDVIPETFADGSPKFVQNMETFMPQGGNTFSDSGWVNSGWMGIPDLGMAMEWECTFDTPGEYIYYCVLHGDAEGNGMAARLVVS